MNSLEATAAWSAPLPDANPPAGMTLHRIPTGSYDTRAVFAVKGGSWRDERHFAATAVLVHHPAGDLLVDAGFGAGVDEHMRAQPRIARTRFVRTATAREQLDAAGYDLSDLRGVLITHAHWDHVSGLDELPVPVSINAAELRYGRTAADGAVFRTVAAGHEIREYDFDGPSYLGFDRSHDVYGDGSVVVALAAGHTPGSVVVFVTTPDGQRYAFIGDLTWQCEGITRRVERPYLLRRMADDDPAVVRQGLSKVIALADLMHVVPAHDAAAFDVLPALV